ncbi:MAG: AI-2E family transporter, partial [Planctomycetaceae bacterium]|nr:AI-2E family transporter [Planctomycetaceae bacterium]
MPESANAVSQDRGISYLYIAAAFVIVVAGMRAAEAIVNPLLLSVFLSVISAPAYFALLKRNVPNWLALLTVVAVLSGIVIGVLYVVVESVAGFTARQDEYLQQIHRETRILRRQFENLMPAWAKPAAETKRADSTDDDADPDGAEPNNADTGAGSSDSGAEPDVGSTLSGKSDSEDSPRDARSSPTQTSAADTVPGLNPNSAPTAAAEFSEDRPAGDGETQTGYVADAEERVN